MARDRHHHTSRTPTRSNWLRRRVGWFVLLALLVGIVAVTVQVGWVGWLMRHPGQTWQWVTERWFSAAALTVVIAGLAVWATLRVGHRQVRSAERLAAEQHAREDEQAAREQQRVAAERQAAWEQRCRSLLLYWPLPRVTEANPYHLGVFNSRRAEAYRGDRSRPPYVPRAADKGLAGLLRSQPLVLVKGQSRAGKSRTAFEVAALEVGDWQLLAPIDRAALAGLAELDPPPGQGERVLVWLDDLDEYLAVEGARGLDAALLGRWAASDPPVKVLATIRLEEYGRLIESPGKLGRTVRELLNRFDPGAITLSTTFDDSTEQAAISRLYPGEPVSGGLAEHLAAAHELVDRLEIGQASFPQGAGLVLAAVDCRRAGLDRPIAKADLVALLPVYLKQLRPLLPMEEGDVDSGLDWATEPVGRTAALLIADPDPSAGTFRVADPVVDYVERRDGRKLAHTAVWEYLLGRVSVDEAVAVGFAAYSRDEPRVTMAALQRAAGSNDPEMASMAAYNLGILLQEMGDVAGARAAYQQAIASGHYDAAPMAARNLGLLLQEQGDVAGSRAVFDRVIASGHPDQAHMAAVNLGVLLREQGDVAGAQAAYQQVIESHDRDKAPIALFNLGVLLREQGDVAGAQAAYQRAIDSGHPDQAPRAAVNLGNLLADQGDVVGARIAYQQAIDSGHRDHAPLAAVNLGNLLRDEGDVVGARAAFQQAIDLGHPNETPKAANNLGALLADRDVVGARAAYQCAIDSDHPDQGPMAAVNLGLLLQKQGDVVGASVAFERAIDSGHPDQAPRAAVNLGVLLARQGDVVGARAAFQRAIDSDHPDAAPMAARNLGLLLSEQGDVVGARAAFQRAIDSGHPDQASAAQKALRQFGQQ
jgi:tetratricopeptide (TPR) repeat protein